MKHRTLSVLRLLLCATVCTAYYGASATAPLRTDDGGTSAASAAQTRPQIWQGKTILKAVVNLHPTKRKGKLVGDKGASGLIFFKAVRYFASSYRVVMKLRFLNLKGGDTPQLGFASSCFTADLAAAPSLTNITNPNAGRKRYSFISDAAFGVRTDAEARILINGVVTSSHAVVGRKGNMLALCGKVQK